MVKHYIAALINAWEMLLEFPVPKVLERLFYEEEESLLPSTTLLFFPVLGLCLGIFVFILYRGLFMVVGNPAASVLATICTVIFLESMSYGKNLTTIVNLLAKLMGNSSRSIDDIQAPKLFAFVSIYLLRICCVGFIFFYDKPFWFIITLTLSFTVQGHMAVKKDDDGEAVFELEDDDKTWHLWALVAILFIVFCLLGKYYFMFIFCATLIAYFFSEKSFDFCMKIFGGVSGKIIGVAGYVFETICLLLGVIFLARS